MSPKGSVPWVCEPSAANGAHFLMISRFVFRACVISSEILKDCCADTVTALLITKDKTGIKIILFIKSPFLLWSLILQA